MATFSAFRRRAWDWVSSSSSTGFRRPLPLRFCTSSAVSATSSAVSSSPGVTGTIDSRSPWLLLSPAKPGEAQESLKLYRLRDGRRIVTLLPRCFHYLCCLGSSPDGWLILLDTSFNPVLLNPADTATAIALPSIKNLEYLPGSVTNTLPYPSAYGNLDLELDFHPLSGREAKVWGSKASHLEGLSSETRRGSAGADATKSKVDRVVSLCCVTYRRDIPYQGTVVADRGLYFGKTVLSPPVIRSPCSSSPGLECTAVGIYGCRRQLAIARTGDERWSPIKTQADLFQDVIHHKGWFYGVQDQGSVEAIDPSANTAGKTEFIQAPTALQRLPGKRYLVEFGGDLLLVNRRRNRVPMGSHDITGGNGYETVGFEIFKLDLKGPRWVEVKSLGNQVLFLGANHSVSLSSGEFPELKSDSIYFVDDYWEHSLWFNHTKIADFGVYCMKDRSIDPLTPFDSHSFQPAPVWVIAPSGVCDSVELPKRQGDLKVPTKQKHVHRPPWLLFPRSKADETRGICKLYSLQDKEEVDIQLPQRLGWRCCLGSTYGWLVTVDSTLTPYLTNLLTGAHVVLPAVENLPGTESARNLNVRLSNNCIVTKSGDLYVGKAVVSWNAGSLSPSLTTILPKKSKHIVLAIQGQDQRLICTRQGDWSWSLLKTEHSGYEDIIHYDGMFYAVTGGRGFVEVLDLNGQVPCTLEEFLGPKMRRCPKKHYLVESQNDLLLVARMFSRKCHPSNTSDDFLHDHEFEFDYRYACGGSDGRTGVKYMTTGFLIFKLSRSDHKWNQLNDLNGRSLILGCNHSLSVSVNDYPGLKDNRIYYTDDQWGHSLHTKCATHFDCGIFNLGDGSIESLAPFDSSLTCQSPVFLVPNKNY